MPALGALVDNLIGTVIGNIFILMSTESIAAAHPLHYTTQRRVSGVVGDSQRYKLSEFKLLKD